jgi:hypothetical protein
MHWGWCRGLAWWSCWIQNVDWLQTSVLRNYRLCPSSTQPCSVTADTTKVSVEGIWDQHKQEAEMLQAGWCQVEQVLLDTGAETQVSQVCSALQHRLASVYNNATLLNCMKNVTNWYRWTKYESIIHVGHQCNGIQWRWMWVSDWANHCMILWANACPTDRHVWQHLHQWY